MAKDSFENNFRIIVEPTLKELGFTEVILDRCMRPQFLFNKERLWFSLSWDWRDRYFDVNFGRLFWFKDVMERVVVIGDYSNYENQITPDSIDRIGSDVEVLKIISQSLEKAIVQYKKKYDEIFENFRVSRSKRGGINIDDYIGPEIEMNELNRFLKL